MLIQFFSFFHSFFVHIDVRGKKRERMKNNYKLKRLTMQSISHSLVFCFAAYRVCEMGRFIDEYCSETFIFQLNFFFVSFFFIFFFWLPKYSYMKDFIGGYNLVTTRINAIKPFFNYSLLFFSSF